MASLSPIFTLLLLSGAIWISYAVDSTPPKEEKVPDLEHDPLHLKQGAKHRSTTDDEHTSPSEESDSQEEGLFETPDSKLYKHIRDQLAHFQGDALVSEIKKIVANIDKDKDNRLNKDELTEWALAEGEKGASANMLDPILWKEFDKDNDGFVTFKEIVHSVGGNSSESETQFEALKFKLADANNDSRLSKEEMVQFMEPHYFRKMTKYVARETMDAYDGDKDGKVTKVEFLSSVGTLSHEDHDESEHFAHLDRDGNQVLDEQEIQSLMTDYGISSIANAQVTRMFEVADQDNNGYLSIDEIFSHPTIFLESGVEAHDDSHEEGEHPGLPKDEVNTGHENEDDDDGEDEHNAKDEL